MEPINRMSAKELVTEKLREAIYKGTFHAGEELIQEKISEQLGVSRMPVREAFLVLENAGLIEIKKNKRAVVTEITVESVQEQLEIRVLLECLAGKKACRNGGSYENLICIQRQIKGCLEGEPKQEEFRFLNKEFHYEIWRLANSPRLEQMLQQLWFSMPSVYPRDIPQNIRRNIEEHQYIIDALLNHDERQVEKAITEHINRTENLVKFLLHQTQDDQ